MNKQKQRSFERIKEMLSFVLSLFILLFLSFFLMNSAPGDPFSDEQGMPPELLLALKKSHGLDQSITTQFVEYLTKLFHGNLGTSLRFPGESVSGIIQRSFPVSFQLGLQAFLLALPIGTAIGLFSAYSYQKKISAVSSVLLTVGISIPTFVVSALLQHSLSLVFPIFPVARWDSFWHTILPTLSLSLVPTAALARIVRANALNVMHMEYISFARLRGIKESRIAFLYILPNAWLPCLQYMSPTVTNMLFGSFAVERVFGIPGLGQWFVTSIMTRDYPVIAGLTAFYSILLFFIGFLVKMITLRFDSRLYNAPAVSNESLCNEYALSTAKKHERLLRS